MARVFQDPKERAKLAAEGKKPDRADWYVQIRDGGKRITKKIGRKKDAEAVASQWEQDKRERGAGVVLQKQRTWEQFRKHYREHGTANMTVEKSRSEADRSIDHLERIVAPRRGTDIDSKALDRFVTERLKERGRNPSETVSRYSVAKNLRDIKAALNCAKRWGYIGHLPEFPVIKLDETDPDVVTEAHFLAMLDHVGVMTLPHHFFDPPAWWTGLLWTLFATGSRIGALLEARWEWLHAQKVTNEAGESDVVHLAFPPSVVKQKKHYCPNVTVAFPYLRAIRPTTARGLIFPWAPHDRRTLFEQFQRLQKAADIKLTCPKAGTHECTDACEFYGWHGFRYAHATYNYGRVSDRELMAQMGHSSRRMLDHYARIAKLNQAKLYNGYVPTRRTAG